MFAHDPVAARRQRKNRLNSPPVRKIRAQARSDRTRPHGNPIALPGSVQSPGGRSPQGGPGEQMIIRSRVVVPMEGAPMNDGAVVVEGTKITDVGPFKDVKRRQGGEVLDLGEQILLPG